MLSFIYCPGMFHHVGFYLGFLDYNLKAMDYDYDTYDRQEIIWTALPIFLWCLSK